MCDACGSGDGHVVSTAINERILASNDRAARYNRDQFHDHDVRAVNLMGAPGAGKTAVLEATARVLGASARFGVLIGDLATDEDAARVRRAGVAAEAITTGASGHLDADMVHKGLHHLPWRDFDYLFIENVGNLVCPAVWDLGQHVNVVALSVTEGENKPLKFPTMFRKADLVLLTKTDLLPALDIDLELIERNLQTVMPRPAMLRVSAKSGEGLTEWVSWLRGIGKVRSAACVSPVAPI